VGSSNRITRRRFLAGASATAASVSVLGRTATARAATAQAFEELIALSAVEAIAAMKRGDLKAEDYARTLLRRCEAGASLNAFITLRPEQVLEAAQALDRKWRAGKQLGALHGLPIPVKDSINTRDLPTTAGSPALRNFQPEADAPVVRALRRAGAIVLGKTNLHELSYGYSSANETFGAVRNPYDPTRIPGGSSGGTAAAIGYRMAPLGVAEDTEGSIRVPAALCGIAGFRPTTGRYSTAGCAPLTPRFDQIGPHARSVADLALFDAVLTEDAAPLRAAALKGARIGLVRPFFFQGLDAEVERVTAAALKALRDAGVELVEGDLPDLAHFVELCTLPVINHDVRPALTRYLSRYRTGITFGTLLAESTPAVRAVIESALTPGQAGYVPRAQYRQVIRRHLPAFRRMYRDYFRKARVAALVFPATILPAPRLGGEDMQVSVAGARLSLYQAFSRNIAPGSTAGLPGLVLPAGLTRSGLPVALEFDGPAGADRALLSLGLAIESVLGKPSAPLDLSRLVT